MHDTHDLAIITDRKWILPDLFLNSIKNVFNVYGDAGQSTAFSTIISSAMTHRMVFQKYYRFILFCGQIICHFSICLSQMPLLFFPFLLLLLKDLEKYSPASEISRN